LIKKADETLQNHDRLAVAFLLTRQLCPGPGKAAPPKPVAPAAKKAYALADVTAQKWTGDLDGMIQRRLIRVLVAYSKTHYFVDKATQRGLTYDFGRLFEDDLNKKLKKKHVRIHVIFVPVSRDELIPALLEGRGDFAAANLTHTPERLKKVV
jgi:membrane-bound lytic murein transglycosylase MltF